MESAGKFVESKNLDKNHQTRMNHYENGITVFDEQTAFRTRDYSLVIGKHVKPTIQAVVKDNLIRINYPGFANVKDPRVQKVIRRTILQTWRIEANRYLPVWLEKLARQYGLTYGRVTFRNNKTRWAVLQGQYNKSQYSFDAAACASLRIHPVARAMSYCA
jgi:predicted metal-dependent hydrolase